MPHDVRVLDPDELRAAHTLFAATIHRGPADDERRTRVVTTYAPGRTLGVGAPDALAGTATSFPTRTAVPGGAELPTAAVTRVGVRADRTRRGLLTAMMTVLLRGCAERGEVLASLRASEARIYDRFGYGIATRGRHLRLRRSGFAGWRAGAPAGGSVRLLERAESVDALTALHDALPLCRPGAIARPAGWWAGLGRHHSRDPLLVAVHTGPDGDDGFAVATIERSRDEAFGEVLRVEDLQAATPAATAGLWRFLYRFADGGAERVDGAGTPDLECDVDALAMAYLGDRHPSELAAAGRWAVREPPALARADALFACGASPWCGTYF